MMSGRSAAQFACDVSMLTAAAHHAVLRSEQMSAQTLHEGFRLGQEAVKLADEKDSSTNLSDERLFRAQQCVAETTKRCVLDRQSTGEVNTKMLPMLANIKTELDAFIHAVNEARIKKLKKDDVKLDPQCLVRTIKVAVDALHDQTQSVHAFRNSNHTVIRTTKEHISMRSHAQHLDSCCKLALRGFEFHVSTVSSNQQLESDVDVENPTVIERNVAPVNIIKAHKALEQLVSHVETKLSDDIDLALGKDLGPLLMSISKLQRDVDALELYYDDAQFKTTRKESMQSEQLARIESTTEALRKVHEEMKRQISEICDTRLYEAPDLMSVMRKALVLALQAAELSRAGTSRMAAFEHKPGAVQSQTVRCLQDTFASGRSEFTTCLDDAWILSPLVQMMDVDDAMNRLLVSDATDPDLCTSFEQSIVAAMNIMQEHVAALRGVAADGGFLTATKDGLALLYLAQCLGKQISHGGRVVQARDYDTTKTDASLKSSHASLFEGFQKMFAENHPFHKSFENIVIIQESACGLVDAVECLVSSVHTPHIDTILEGAEFHLIRYLETTKALVDLPVRACGSKPMRE